MVLWALLGRWAADLRPASRAGRGRRGSRSRVAAGRRGRCWRWPRCSPWRRSSSGRRRGWPRWPAASAISSISPASPTTPFHLVNFVAPGLFHRSALWRPIVWDPFHTSPEEMSGLYRAGAAVPGRLAMVPRIPPRRGRPAPDDPGPGHVVPEPGSLRAGIPRPDRAARLLVLPGPVAMEPGDVPGAGDPGGQGVRPLARSGPGRVARCDGSSSSPSLWVGVVLGLIELAVRSTAETGLAPGRGVVRSRLSRRCRGTAIPAC